MIARSLAARLPRRGRRSPGAARPLDALPAITYLGAQALPSPRPWAGRRLTAHLILDLLYNLMLESTVAAEVPHLRDDRQQDGPLHDRVPDRARSGTRERLREGAGEPRRQLGRRLPIPKTNAERFPRSRSSSIWACRASSTPSARRPEPGREALPGASPSNDGTELSTAVMPEGFPMTIAPERREEFAPGLDKELLRSSRPPPRSRSRPTGLSPSNNCKYRVGRRR